MKTSTIAVAALAAAAIAAPAHALTVPLDLNDFEQEGPAGNGNWSVSVDGTNVFQSTNGNPTAVVSPNSFVNSSFEGSFGVETTGDDDYIGFVFGFGADETDPFFLFTWKQGDQSGSQQGFTLSRVTGGFNSIPFSNHQDDDTGYDVVATDVGAGKGWADNTVYDFKLTYQSSLTRIEVGPEGGALDEIFSVGPAVFGLAQFEAGRFGFYNHSQSSVRYQGFTQAEAPEPEPEQPGPNAVPLPPAMMLLALGLGGLGAVRMRRRA